MNKLTFRVVIVAIVLVVAFIIIFPKLDFLKANNKTTNQPENNSKKATSTTSALAVKAIVAQPQVLDNKVLTTGTILANEEVSISSEISGKVSQIYFSEGNFVATGALLVKIDDRELQAQLIKLLANKKLIETKEKRQKELLAKEAISQQEYDIAITELNAINADIGIINVQIEKTNIRAPFSGVVGLRKTSVGSYLSPNTPIVTLTSFNPAKIDFSVPSKYSSLIKNGADIKFTTETTNKTYQGKVYAIEPKIDESTRTILMRATAPNPDKELLPGGFAKIELTLETVKDAILLPTQAVIPELGGHKVFVVKNGMAKSQPIEIGIRTETDVQVLSGIQKGDTVITTGILQLRTDMPVSLQEVK